MLKKTVKYTDFNGTAQVEDLYFHLTETELIRMEVSDGSGSLSERIGRLNVADPNRREIIALFEDLIQASYGEKSVDGKRFVKNQRIVEEFTSTEAYNALFMELLLDPNNAGEFINGLIPADLLKKAQEQTNASPEDIRKASEALMQGYKQKQEPKKTVETGVVLDYVEEQPVEAPNVDTMTEEQKAELRKQLGM